MKVFLSFYFIFVLNLNFIQGQVITTYNLENQNSSFIWNAKKFLGSHNGILNCKKGSISFEQDKIISGIFEMDMRSIEVKDLSGNLKALLEKHLVSSDFFDVERFPLSLLEFKSSKLIASNNNINEYKIVADLTIKGITKEIIFEGLVKNYSKKIVFSTELNIDRTDYNIIYMSAKYFKKLKDAAIADIFKVKVVFTGTLTE